MIRLGKYSLGIGDRFGHEGSAQLAAFLKAREQGVVITPVWNKSHREHTLIKTRPASVRVEADQAVKALGWRAPYFVDADHINLRNVDLFMDASDFFTLDVADDIGQSAPEDQISTFVKKYQRYTGEIKLPLLPNPMSITTTQIDAIARKYLLAVKLAGRIYRHIEAIKGPGQFITEVSMDETQHPQTPGELLFILAAMAEEGIPAQTIAPKFCGRFNKGVDYVGDVNQFAQEFEADLAVIALAIKEFKLPSDLKLSIHSGSDKFSIYPAIHEALKKFDAGLHVKTAGTTWLEEVIGLAQADGEGLVLAKRIYREAWGRFEELCEPYATVIDIHKAQLPTPDNVDGWSSEELAARLRHDQTCAHYDPQFRQLVHVSFKVAAEIGEPYLQALVKYRDIIAQNVGDNILKRHIIPIFFDRQD